MAPVGYYDPDGDERDSTIQQRPAPKTDLQRTVLEACGRKTFSGPQERAAWRKIEAYALGADHDSLLFEEWILFCARVWKKANTPVPTRSYSHLVKWIMNTPKRDDWILNNRARILKERAERMQAQTRT